MSMIVIILVSNHDIYTVIPYCELQLSLRRLDMVHVNKGSHSHSFIFTQTSSRSDVLVAEHIQNFRRQHVVWLLLHQYAIHS